VANDDGRFKGALVKKIVSLLSRNFHLLILNSHYVDKNRLTKGSFGIKKFSELRQFVPRSFFFGYLRLDICAITSACNCTSKK